ncbi:MAG: hypothetical protein QME78_09395 [Thermodesulfobacteriota bacterium]|nr:hypothetical protein [Thermodesulfobacteriota bacterium]
MKVKILGPGCINCLKLELLAAQAAKELGLPLPTLETIKNLLTSITTISRATGS